MEVIEVGNKQTSYKHYTASKSYHSWHMQGCSTCHWCNDPDRRHLMTEQLLATKLLGSSVVFSTVTYSMSVPTCMSATSHIVQWIQQIVQMEARWDLRIHCTQWTGTLVINDSNAQSLLPFISANGDLAFAISFTMRHSHVPSHFPLWCDVMYNSCPNADSCVLHSCRLQIPVHAMLCREVGLLWNQLEDHLCKYLQCVCTHTSTCTHAYTQAHGQSYKCAVYS